MSKYGKLRGLCQNCARFHPKGLANCILARDAARIAGKHKYNLMVTDCEFHTLPEKVFPDSPEENGSDITVDAVLEKDDEE